MQASGERPVGHSPLVCRAGPGATAALLCWLMLYVYLAMKKVYGQGWFVTAIKYMMLGVAYVCLLTFGIGITLLATVFLA